MAVVSVQVRARRPYEDGRAFGDAGSYERLDGVVHFAADPDAPANREIVDLGRAPRDADGRVRFEADFCLLQPAASSRPRPMLYVVANRGRLQSVPLGNAVVPTEITDRIEPGDGHLLRHGWIVLWVGWQWDVVRRPGVVGLEAPQALGEDGRPIQGRILLQFQPNVRHPDEALAHWPLSPAPGNPDFVHRPYPTADVDDPDATLTVRDHPAQTPTLIPRRQWRFARDEGGMPVADDTRVWLEGGFDPGRIYEVTFRTRVCPVVGTGLLATRDAVSFFRNAGAAAGNPAAGRVRSAIGYGVSQCGRFLRTFLYHGLNQDEAGRQVFDGVMPVVAGARRGEFNHRFAQPSVQHAPGFGHLPPFLTGDLLERQRSRGGVPRIFEVNTSSEYWRVDCSLVHTTADGRRDVEPPADVRMYMLAGTQHGAGAVPPTKETPAGARTANLQNVVNYVPLTRAALENLRAWVEEGVEPPPSAIPRLADGTAVPREQILERFGGISGVALPDPALMPTLRREDAGPRASEGVLSLPVRLGEPYPSYVSDVDADLNEVAGIRMPDLAVPVASHTGWNPRDPETGGAGQMVDMMGSTIPLPKVDGTPDRRRPLAGRYAGRDDYLARVRAAARALVERRHLLAEDVDLAVSLAAERYDALASDPDERA